MKSKIEKKIKETLEAILRKDHIDYFDYQILKAELGTLEMKENAEKYAAEAEERKEQFSKLTELMFNK